MRRFIRMFANDEQGYKRILEQRDAATKELNQFYKIWVAPAKQDELHALIRKLVYTHQQTVSYQTEHDVDEGDIETY
jgi:hypothetical protein